MTVFKKYLVPLNNNIKTNIAICNNIIHGINTSMNYKQKYYIGRTNNPNIRLHQHMKTKNMKNMYLIGRMDKNCEQIKELEDELIKQHGKYNICLNKPNTKWGGGYSGGFNPYKTNYIYLLFY